MNFSFEGNYKPRRNINLGGVKHIEDKRSLMLKAQAERAARELERKRLKSALLIQTFYRGRNAAAVTRNTQRLEFEQLLSRQDSNDIATLSRLLISFYQPAKDSTYLDQYIAFVTNHVKQLMDIKNVVLLDSWTWIVCLLIKKVLLPSISSQSQATACQFLSLLINPTTYPKAEDETRIRIITFAFLNTPLLETLKEAIVNSSNPQAHYALESIIYQLAILNPPYYYATSPLIEEHRKFSNTPYLTRPTIVNMMTTNLLTQPFLLDNISDTVIIQLVTHLPLSYVLDAVAGLFQMDVIYFDEMAVAGLLMNITKMGDMEHGKHLEGSLAEYAKAIQLLLTYLPVSYLADPTTSVDNTDGAIDNNDSSDDEEEQDQDRDTIMKEATPSKLLTAVNPLIRAKLELLYDSERVNNLLYRFMQLATESNSNEAIQSISSLFNTLMLRRPMKKDTILNTLLYKSANTHHLMQILWGAWSTSKEASLFGDINIVNNLQEATKAITESKGASFESWSILYLLCEVYTRLLLTIGDDEFTKQNPLDIAQVIMLSTQLKNISFVMFWRANTMDLTQHIGHTGIQLNQLRTTVTHLLQQVHMRDSRRRFCKEDHWLIPDLDTDNFSSEAVAEEFNLESEQEADKSAHLRARSRLSKGRLAVISPRLGLLNNIPFVIPFEQRVQIFRMFVNNDKKRNKIEDYYRQPKQAAKVRRDHMFQDGFAGLNTLGVGLKDKVAISFVDEFGLEEAGIDGGGVFKEFLTGLSKDAFNTSYGLFVSTPDQLLYPNPTSFATEPQQLEYFQFLGLIIGKAVYEGILLDVPFAEFFLKKCLGKVNYLDDLASLDPELYKGLISVKNYDGNVEDLSLDFTSTHLENGKTVTVDLIPHGSYTAVTNQNRIQYIYLVANYRLNVQIAKQCRAFFLGLSTIIDIKWLRMFNQQELQVVLGGASVPIDLADLRQYTVLAGYMDHDATVKNFWRALESFDNELRMKFVKFVTSCSRPPLLGFKELVPQFCLRNAGIDDHRLPTSSTCVNLLKLPNFSSYEILREKLLYAITADAGFDLS